MINDIGKALIDPIDIHKAVRRKDIELASDNSLITDPMGTKKGDKLDVEWLKLAASEYNLSPDIKDYVMVPVVIMYANIPNRNGVGFDLKDLSKFYTALGVPAYKTWRGKGTYLEHDNREPKKSNGIVLDSTLRKSGQYWKVLTYLGLDRSKNSDLVDRVVSKKLKSYSMGAQISGGYECSICRKKRGTCNHLSMDPRAVANGMRVIDTGRRDRPELAFSYGRYPVGFEVSIVEKPAYFMASNDNVQYF